MYPIFRTLKELWIHRAAAPLDPYGTHVSHHVCWPWDLDYFLEMNNGRTLTLFDLGRVGLGQRTGLLALVRDKGWGLTIAGASVRYRSRVRVFDRLEMRTRGIGFDARFLYVEQSMWRGRTCTSHALMRIAVTDRAGLVPAERVIAAWGGIDRAAALPGWAQAWADADAQRPWPPEM